MPHWIFLSYSNLDMVQAEAICRGLESKGISVWMAPRDILPGQAWAGSITAAIKQASAMVLVLSNKTSESPHIQSELRLAFDNRLPIVPFRVEDVALVGELEYFVGSSQWLDTLTGPIERHIDVLAQAIAQLLKINLAKFETGADRRPLELPPAVPLDTLRIIEPHSPILSNAAPEQKKPLEEKQPQIDLVSRDSLELRKATEENRRRAALLVVPRYDIAELERLAIQGDPESQCRLGLCYQRGLDVRIDLAEARRWYTAAAVQGHAEGIEGVKALDNMEAIQRLLE